MTFVRFERADVCGHEKGPVRIAVRAVTAVEATWSHHSPDAVRVWAGDQPFDVKGTLDEVTAKIEAALAAGRSCRRRPPSHQ